MKQIHITNRTTRKAAASIAVRKGLAPLEMVLSLPLLLFVMALILMMGTAGAWKIRALSTSREAVWTTLGPHSGHDNPHPKGWPQNAPLNVRSASPPVLDSDPYAHHSVVRGPTISTNNMGGEVYSLNVKLNTLDMNRGLVLGHTHLKRKFPLLSADFPKGIDFPRDHLIQGGSRWQITDMGIANYSRRTLRTYEINFDGYDPTNFLKYQTATNQATTLYNQPALFPLDRDEELRNWFGGYHQHLVDFHPGPSSRCDDDPLVLQQLSDQVVDRVHRVPERMGKTFQRMYQEQLDELNALDPPPANLASETARLQELIDQLNAFLGSL